MKNGLKHSIAHSVFIRHNWISYLIQNILYASRLKKAQKMNRSVTAPRAIKEKTIRRYARRYGIKTFVETGTFWGDMVAAVKNRFKRIFTIELDTDLHARAEKTFSKYNHITCIQGDSSTELVKLLATINDRCLFWLDAHFSGGITTRGSLDTPVMQELSHILAHPVKGHVLLIDDAMYFDGTNDYPTMECLTAFLKEKSPTSALSVKDDIIRIVPGS